jgi:hypothetical protein
MLSLPRSGLVLLPIIRNHEMLNQVQHDNRGEFSVTLNQVLNLIQDLTVSGSNEY